MAKACVLPAAFAGFFAVYFHLLRNPGGTVTTIPATLVDAAVPFTPWAFVPYASLWIYVTLAAGATRGRREVAGLAAAAASLACAGFAIFRFFPTAMPAPGIDWTPYPLLHALKTVDAAGNAFPSLHVAYAVFAAVWLERTLRQVGAAPWLRGLNLAWAAAIVWSTLATKQHVAADALAGLALGGAAALFDPRSDAGSVAYSRLNRTVLAFLVTVSAKAALWSAGLFTTHPVAAWLGFFAPDAWILLGLLLPNHDGLIPTVTHFETRRREVWLTIDDGPEPATTPAMLDLLERHGARATFFVIGVKARRHPELIGEIRRRGHDVGNHTHTHPLATFWLAGPRRTAREIDGCADALASAPLAQPSPWVRCPAGIKTLFLRRVLARRNLRLIGWTARGRETVATTIDAPLRRLRRGVRPGAILILHESPTHGPARLALLTAVLDHLTAEGYRCVLPAAESLR